MRAQRLQTDHLGVHVPETKRKRIDVLLQRLAGRQQLRLLLGQVRAKRHYALCGIACIGRAVAGIKRAATGGEGDGRKPEQDAARRQAQLADLAPYV